MRGPSVHSAKALDAAWQVAGQILFGDESIVELTSFVSLAVFLYHTEDCERALDYFQQALRVQEKVLGKAHPDTLRTIMEMAILYGEGLGERVREEEMYRLVLDGFEKSLGKDLKDTKRCAYNLAVLFFQGAPSKEKLRSIITEYPHLLQQGIVHFRNFIIN